MNHHYMFSNIFNVNIPVGDSGTGRIVGNIRIGGNNEIMGKIGTVGNVGTGEIIRSDKINKKLLGISGLTQILEVVGISKLAQISRLVGILG